MDSNIGKFVFPGDKITDIKSLDGKTILGPGLHRNKEETNVLNVTKPGTLRFKQPNVYWVDSKPCRYLPKKGDLVVGVIAKKGGDMFKVDLGSSEPASLTALAFEGATKKQKPDLQVGDLVYARVLSAHKDMEMELVCVDSYGKAGKLGPLSNDGFLITVRPHLAHRLLTVENPLLQTLGKKFPFEVAIGMNGKIWVRAKNVKDTIKLVRAIEACERQSDKAVVELCRNTL